MNVICCSRDWCFKGQYATLHIFQPGTGSDWSTEDLDFENEGETKVMEWDKEVERELALQVNIIYNMQ